MGSIAECALLTWAQRRKTRENLPVRLSWSDACEANTASSLRWSRRRMHADRKIGE